MFYLEPFILTVMFTGFLNSVTAWRIVEFSGTRVWNPSLVASVTQILFIVTLRRIARMLWKGWN